MRFMISMLAATMAIQPATAFAQDDDWEFQQDPARKLSVAAVRYDDGKAIIARCQDGDLKLVVVGLPEMQGPSVRLDAERPDGRRDVQQWKLEGEGAQAALSSGAAARDIRFLRGGGVFSLHTRPGAPRPTRIALDLPSQSANLDRLLTECGRPLQDERDRLPRTEPKPLSPEDRARAARVARQPEGRFVGAAEISCLVRNGRLAECRVENEQPRGYGQSVARSMNGDRADALDPAAAEGTVTYMSLVAVEREALVSNS